MPSKESIYNIVVFSGNVHDPTIKDKVHVLPSPYRVAVWCSLHRCEHGHAIGHNHELVCPQLSCNKV